MLIETSIFLLVLLLALILSYYNQRQARALEAVQNMAEDLVAIQIKDRRAQYEKDAQGLQVDEWIARHIHQVVERPVEIATWQVIQDVQAIDVTLKDGGKVVISPTSETDIKRRDRRNRGRSRLAMFAANATRPLLPRRYKTLARTLLDNEFLDIEADVISSKLGLGWRSPTRLWFYVA